MITTEVSIGSHYLYPSNLFVTKDPHFVTTVLGSCVSVCLFDTKNKFGGINHFMLPFWNGDGLASVKYGNIAMTKLIEDMLRKGSNKEDLEAKVFGGANQANFSMKIGDRNAEIAINHLNNENIPIKAQSLGGIRGRKIIFEIHTGVVRMKYIQSSQQMS